MVRPLPLSALLSQALVAYTIEFDNEFEQRVPHTTTVGQGAGIRGDVVWLVSQVMWTNLIRLIGDDGTPVRELQANACLSESATKSRLHHLEWWHYVTFSPDPSDGRGKPPYRDLLVHLTPAGRRARDAWAPLTSLIDKRWRGRFGKDAIDALTRSLRTIVSGTAEGLPDYLPVVDYSDGMRATLVLPDVPRAQIKRTTLEISALLSRALLALTLEFERASDVSLTISADVLRIIDIDGTPLKELPTRAGVAKEGTTAAVNFLKKNGFVAIGTDKAKTVQLTAKGRGRSAVTKPLSRASRSAGRRTSAPRRSASCERPSRDSARTWPRVSNRTKARGEPSSHTPSRPRRCSATRAPRCPITR